MSRQLLPSADRLIRVDHQLLVATTASAEITMIRPGANDQCRRCTTCPPDTEIHVCLREPDVARLHLDSVLPDGVQKAIVGFISASVNLLAAGPATAVLPRDRKNRTREFSSLEEISINNGVRSSS